MKLRWILALMVILFAFAPMSAQAKGGPDGSGYVWSEVTPNWQNAITGGKSYNVGGDAWSNVAFPNNFEFTFYGTTYKGDGATTAYVNDNGLLAFDNTATPAETWTPAEIPTNGQPEKMIAAFWIDGNSDCNLNMNPAGTNAVYTKQTTTNGYTSFVTTWDGIALYEPPGNQCDKWLTFQATLFEGTDILELSWDDVLTHSGPLCYFAEVGLEGTTSGLSIAANRDDGTGGCSQNLDILDGKTRRAWKNDATDASSQSVSTVHDNAVAIALTTSDDPLTYTIDTPPTSGAIDLAAGLHYKKQTVTYTPNANFVGTDSFTYTVSDGFDDPQSATVTISVTNSPATAADQSVDVDEDTSVAITLSSTDPEGDPISFAITDPTYGTLTGTAPDLTYTPNGDFFGTDSFTYTTDDGLANQPAMADNSGTITINVASVNDAPSFLAGNDVSVSETDGPFAATWATDIRGGPANEAQAVTFELTQVSNTATFAQAPTIDDEGTLTFTPQSHGYAEFDVVALDGSARSDPARLNIEVTEAVVLNQPPTASDDTVDLDEDSSVTQAFSAVDPDGDSLAFNTGSVPEGFANNGDGTYTYTPPANFNGEVTATFTATDGEFVSDGGTITFRVAPINDDPTTGDDVITVSLNTPRTFTALDLLGNDADIDGDDLTIQSISPGVGTIAGLTYTPATDFIGDDAGTYTISDGTTTVDGTVVFRVTGSANQDPAAGAVNLVVAHMDDLLITPAMLVANSNDPDGDALTPTLGAASLGNLASESTGWRYTANAVGSESIALTVSDGRGGESSTTLTIDVTPVAPTLELSMSTGTSLLTTKTPIFFGATATGSYPISSWHWTIDGQSLQGQNVEYSFQNLGERTVSLTVIDEGSQTATETLTFEIVHEAPEPTITVGNAVAGEPTMFTSEFTGIWNYGDGHSDGTGSHTYTPGTYTVTFTVTDSFGAVGQASKVITVVAAPVVDPEPQPQASGSPNIHRPDVVYVAPPQPVEAEEPTEELPEEPAQEQQPIQAYQPSASAKSNHLYWIAMPLAAAALVAVVVVLRWQKRL